MWPFKKKKNLYVNGHPLDKVKHAFEWFGGVFVIMQGGDAYIIKSDWRTEDYKVIRVECIDGRLP